MPASDLDSNYSPQRQLACSPVVLHTAGPSSCLMVAHKNQKRFAGAASSTYRALYIVEFHSPRLSSVQAPVLLYVCPFCFAFCTSIAGGTLQVRGRATSWCSVEPRRRLLPHPRPCRTKRRQRDEKSGIWTGSVIAGPCVAPVEQKEDAYTTCGL